MQKKLKVGILLDSFLVPAWVWEMVNSIVKDKLAVIDTLIVNQTPKSSGKPSPFLYRLFSKFDRTFFKVKESPFTRKDIRKIPGLTPFIQPVTPIQKKFSDYFSSEDLELVRSRDLDILIRFGFRILRGGILTIPKLGVWSYHHGDNMVYRGGPPCFWEVMKGWKVTGSLLQILTESLDDGHIISRSWSRTDPLSVHRNAAKVYWKSLYFIPRELDWINRNGVDAWKSNLKNNPLSPNASTIPNLRPPSNLEMLGLIRKWILRNLRRKLHEFSNSETWELWIKPTNKNEWKRVNNPSGTYLADPFIIEHQGESILFAEQYKYAERKAYISYAYLNREGEAGPFQVCIQEPFHLSYPFVLFSKGKFWMWLEAATNKGLRLYEATLFPANWKLKSVQLESYNLYDPTICEKDGLFWLFANTKAHSEASSFDELSLFFTTDIEIGDWQAHPQNPIVSDVRCSRPAGALFEKSGFWYRPAQDSGKHYGHRIKIQRITNWNTEEYEEITEEIIEADWVAGLQGTHTINRSQKFMVMDSFRR